MKKVILTAMSFAAFAVANAQQPTHNHGMSTANGSLYDQENVGVNILINDMISLTPDNVGPGNAPGNAAQQVSFTSGTNNTNWGGWNTVQSLGSVNWTISATRAYALYVRRAGGGYGLARTTAAPAGSTISNELSQRRLGAAITSTVAPTHGTAMTAAPAITPNTANAVPTSGGLTGGYQLLGSSDHGAIGAGSTVEYSFYPSVYDNLSGTYEGIVMMSAELLP